MEIPALSYISRTYTMLIICLQFYAVTSFIFVLASICGFCLETLPQLSVMKNITRECTPGAIEETRMRKSSPYLEYLDHACTSFFTLELIVRVTFAPNKLRFIRSPMNLIDVAALLPLYVQIILGFTDEHSCLRTNRAVIETIFVLRIIRIFRIFHLVKHYKALKILVHAIRASIQELLMLSIFLIIAMLVFATLIFYAERPHPLSDSEFADFKTIPVGFWWAIITMTTVGYGDVYPKTAMGSVIGGLCAVWGVLLIALTIPVISNNFTLFYLHCRTRDDINRKTYEVAFNTEIDSEKDPCTNNKCPTDKNVDKNKGNEKTLLVHADSNSLTDDAEGSASHPTKVPKNDHKTVTIAESSL